MPASMGGEWVEALKETAPHITRDLAIMHPETLAHQGAQRTRVAEPEAREMQAAARKLGLHLHVAHASNEQDFSTVSDPLCAREAHGRARSTRPGCEAE